MTKKHIIIEGADRSGKTTLISRLSEIKGTHWAIFTKSMGEGPVASFIRERLIDNYKTYSHDMQVGMALTARAEMMQDAEADGRELMISDRGWLSTLVYQFESQHVKELMSQLFSNQPPSWEALMEKVLWTSGDWHEFDKVHIVYCFADEKEAVRRLEAEKENQMDDLDLQVAIRARYTHLIQRLTELYPEHVSIIDTTDWHSRDLLEDMFDTIVERM